MKPVVQHPWDIDIESAIEIQTRLADRVSRVDSPKFAKIDLVAGIDVTYSKDETTLAASAVIFDATNLDVIESTSLIDTIKFPYVSGLFAFRELPPIIKCFSQLQHKPDLVICDGQGVLHPRRFGLASHLGVIFDMSTIGCGKSLLLGTHGEIEKARGSKSPIKVDSELLGMALRTQSNVNPIFVSSGHKISVVTACEWVLKFSPNYRLPETTRIPDQLSRAILRNQ